MVNKKIYQSLLTSIKILQKNLDALKNESQSPEISAKIKNLEKQSTGLTQEKKRKEKRSK